VEQTAADLAFLDHADLALTHADAVVDGDLQGHRLGDALHGVLAADVDRGRALDARTGGISVTCRRSIPVSAAPARDSPHRAQHDGTCRTRRSGLSVRAIVAPGCPFGRPGFRPLAFRSDFGAGLPSPSDDGGFEGFCEFIPTLAARSATCACSPAASASSSAARARSTPSSATWPRSTAISASRSASSSRSRAFAARSPAASSGTPVISGTSRTTPQHAEPGK